MDFDISEFKKYYLENNYTREQMSKLYNVGLGVIKRYIKKYQIKKPKELLTANRRTTCQLRYGAENPAQVQEFKQKIMDTNLVKYGVVNCSSSKIVQNKRRDTMQDRYGVDYSGQSEILTQKRIDTMRAKYGVEYWTQIEHGEREIEIVNSKEKLYKYIETCVDKTSYGIARGLGYDKSTIEKKCLEFGISNMISSADYISKEEKEITALLDSWGIKSYKNKKSIYPYEIDVYCPEYNVGIEFNGAYWHREEQKGKLYHQIKAMKAQEQGIQLFQIFDYEWYNPRIKQRIISRIKNILFQNTIKLYGRQCSIIQIQDKKTKKDFLENNHIQGNDRSSITLGLMYQNELVSIMCFGKPRINKQVEQELTRYACKEGYNVIGGAMKLLTYFIKHFNCNSIVSYSDMTKTTGNLYEKLGFNYIKLNKPRYVWCKTGVVLSRYKTQIKNEYTEMTKQGFYRVYDAGTITWIWKRQED